MVISYRLVFDAVYQEIKKTYEIYSAGIWWNGVV